MASRLLKDWLAPGVLVHLVAARIGDDPATLLRSYSNRTKRGEKNGIIISGLFRRAGHGRRLALHWRHYGKISVFDKDTIQELWSFETGTQFAGDPRPTR
jgi:hypothetical protein